MSRVVIASVVTLIIIALLATGIYFYQKYSIILINPLKVVPPDAAFIIEAKKPESSLRQFFLENNPALSLSDNWLKTISSNFFLLDSLLKKDGDAKDIWQEQSLVISAHLVNATNFDYLFAANLPRGWSEGKLKRFIEKALLKSKFISVKGLTAEFNKREYEDVNIYELPVNESEIFTFASIKSVAVFSFTPLLVEQAIHQLKQGGGITQSQGFKKVTLPQIKASGIYFYFSYSSFSDFLATLDTDTKNLFFNLTSSFARWSGLYVTNNTESISFKGLTTTFDTTDYLSFFRNQQSQRFDASRFAPNRTVFLSEFGFSNFKEYSSHTKYSTWFSDPSIVDGKRKVFVEIEKKFAVSVEESFTDWIGKEIGLIITEPAGSFIDNNVYAAVYAKNADDAILSLNKFRDAVVKAESNLKTTEEKYKSHTISSIPLKGIIPTVYGKAFSSISNCFYTSINDVILFANQSSSLKIFIDDVLEGKVLSKDSLYASTEKTLPVANCRLYVNPKRLQNLFIPNQLTSFFSTIYQASGIFAQWSYQGAAVNTELSINFRVRTMKEPALIWSTQLDTAVACKAVVVEEPNEDSPELKQTSLFVQDAKNNLYKIDDAGNIVWKKNIEEQILSPLHVVDLYRDGRQQILFNTSRKLYLMNTRGDNVGNYPIRLPAVASNGCSVISTTAGHNTFVACSNHYVYAYEGNGKPVADWQYVHTDEVVSKPIQIYSVNNSTCLIISENNGAITLTDRKGGSIASFKDKLAQSANSTCELIKTDSSGKAIWVTTDTTGSIIQFSNSGEVVLASSAARENFSSRHSFIIDQTNKAQNIIIYADSGKLIAKNLFPLPIKEKSAENWSINIPGIVPSSLMLLKLANGAAAYGISSYNNLFYVINLTSDIEKGFPVHGNLFPSFVTNSRQLLLCGNEEGMLYVYKTE